MTSAQRSLIVFLAVILLFISTLFRTEMFAVSVFGTWLFKIIVLGQFLLLILLFGYCTKKPWWISGGLLLFTEIAVWAYAYQLADGQHRHAPGRLFFQDVVDGWDKNLIQYDPELSQYDPALFYTLKPNTEGVSFQSGFEIDTPIRTNRLGVRDDAISLNNPEVILLGDSFTMGWGVPDSTCFASILERRLGRSVLNAGISSFGTARESQLLQRIKHDSCRVLVIQYCINDQIENEEFLAGTFKPSSQDKYRAAVHYNTLMADYYPFKYVYAILKACVQKIMIWHSESSTAKPLKVSRRSTSAEESFFFAVRRIREQYKGPIVITCLNPISTSPEMIQGFRSYLDHHSLSGIYLADVSDLLTPEDYFTLDNHINQSGHRKVAERLVEIIRSNHLL